jgi:hypothetical protein
MRKSNTKDFQDVRQRAAEIRGSWTMSERRRRLGLPPDAPTKLRDLILSCRTDKWVPNPAVAAR